MHHLIQLRSAKPLATLPNQNGFRFWGVRPDGTHDACYVNQCRHTGTHFVDGEAGYDELIGWLPRK